MKTKSFIILLVATLAAPFAFGAYMMYAYTTPSGKTTDTEDAMGCLKADEIINAGGKLELGQWYTGWKACKTYADENGIPVVFLQSNSGCVHCWWTDKTFRQDAFKDWAATHDAGKVIYCYIGRGERGCPDQDGSEADTWMWKGDGGKGPTISSFPVTVLWWAAKGINQRRSGDSLCANANGAVQLLDASTLPKRVENVIAKMEKAFAGWEPPVEITYAGGYFTETNYPHASLQAESGTTSVDVEIVRTALVATNQQMTISAEGKVTETKTISWAEGQTAQTNHIDNFNKKWFVAGKDVTLQLWGQDKDGKDEVASEVMIRCFTADEATTPSAANPKWMTETFQPGEWTMNFEEAKAKAYNGDYSYVLVCIQGSQWCPDCGNVEKNFLDVKDAGGKNRFSEWAIRKGVALVAIDVPRFTSASVEADSPCLLKRDAYATDPEKSGTKMPHSGLGYLTRKMVSDAEARRVLERNHELVTKMTYEGGFHRPEDSSAFRTGVPIFVLLDKFGNVRARLTRWAAVSPTSSAGFDNYLKRFDEMLDIAKNNATEIENNAATESNRLTLTANGGEATNRISHVDAVDTFRLGDFKGNAVLDVTVKSDTSEAKVIVSFVSVGTDGKEIVLASTPATALSRTGIALTHTFSESGTYFVKVEAAMQSTAPFDFQTEELRDGYDGSTFQEFVVSSALIAVPQEDFASMKPPANSDKVKVRLTAGTLYRLAGMKDNGCDELSPVPGHPNFFWANASGDFDVTLTRVNGLLEYQIWRAGTVEFVETEGEVPESVCDLAGQPLEIPINRRDGKSGRVTVTVTVDRDPEQTTLEEGRYWLLDEAGAKVESVDLTWDNADGKKPVRLYIDDDIYYDGNRRVVLKAEVSSCDAGDVTFVTGRDVHTLTVIEDDKNDPGRIFFTDVEPGFAQKRVVYGTAGETNVLITATRADSVNGLAAGVLLSSVAGTTFTTEDPRDLEDIGTLFPEFKDLYPGAKVLYWSAREEGDKQIAVGNIPAGQTARILLVPLNCEGYTASNTLTVVSVAAGAPRFAKSEATLEFCRYADYTESAQGLALESVGDGEISFLKLAGTLPAGLEVVALTNGPTKALRVVGRPTAPSGTYPVAYQVREMRGGKLIPGLTVDLTIRIFDVAAAPVSAEQERPYNPAIARSRTLSNIPVWSTIPDDEGRFDLIGVLRLTIPSRGNVSGKFVGSLGTISYSASAWNSAPDREGTMTAKAVSRDGLYAIDVEACADGSVKAEFHGEGVDGCRVRTDGVVWSNKNPASDWRGYYTVALKYGYTVSAAQPGTVPNGYGYLTLKMNSTSAVNAGTFTMAGRLADGTRLSGSLALVLAEGEGYLPIFWKSTRDEVAEVLGVKKGAWAEKACRCIESVGGHAGRWTRAAGPTGSEDPFELKFTSHGSYYDAGEPLCGCCVKYYQTTNMVFVSDAANLIAAVTVLEDTIRVDPAENPGNLSLSFNRPTGIFTGMFDQPGGDRVPYFGVLVNGWGNDCGCERAGEVFLPFMSGSHYSGGTGGLATVNPPDPEK